MSKVRSLVKKLTLMYVIIVLALVISFDIYLYFKTNYSDNLFYSIIGVKLMVLIGLASLFYLIGNRLFVKRSRDIDRYIQLLKEHASTIEKSNRLETITEHIDTGIILIDPNEYNFPITFVNKGFEQLSGYPMSEVFGQSLYILKGRDTEEEQLNKISRAMKYRRSVEVEILIYLRDGTTNWINLRMHPIFDKDYNLTHYLGFLTDIHKRKIAEFLLEENEERYKSLFLHNTDIVLSIDLNGRIEHANPQLTYVTGYEENEVIGCELNTYLEKSNRFDAKRLLSLTNELQRFKRPIKIHHKNGSVIELQVGAIPIKVQSKVVGFYVIARDMTEYNKTQEILRRSDKLNVVGELAAGVAHEIRNPLTSLKGFIQLIDTTSNVNQQYLQVMNDEIDRINQIVSELLLLAKPQLSDFKVESLKNILQHVQTLLNTQAILKGIHITLAYEAQAIYISCIDHQMKQVFINIIKNAIEAMPNGGSIHIVTKQSSKDKVLVRITDEGVGIPKSRLSKLGEPFYTTKERGTGLGLMVSFKIIEEHSGLVNVTSEQHVGTTFDIVLPCVKDKSFAS